MLRTLFEILLLQLASSERSSGQSRPQVGICSIETDVMVPLYTLTITSGALATFKVLGVHFDISNDGSDSSFDHDHASAGEHDCSSSIVPKRKRVLQHPYRTKCSEVFLQNVDTKQP